MERSTSWNEIERLAVDRFYGDYSSTLIALGVCRDGEATRVFANEYGLSASNRGKPRLGVEQEFWSKWRTFLKSSMGMKGVTELTWKPAQDIPCEKCTLDCYRYAPKLPCERYTVREMLEYGCAVGEKLDGKKA